MSFTKRLSNPLSVLSWCNAMSLIGVPFKGNGDYDVPISAWNVDPSDANGRLRWLVR